MIALHCVESALLVALKIIQSHSVLKIYKSICCNSKVSKEEQYKVLCLLEALFFPNVSAFYLDEHVVFLCLFYNDNIQKEKKKCFVFSKVAILDAILNMTILQLAKICKPQQPYNLLARLDQNANKHSNKHSLSDQCIDSIGGKPYW